MANLKSLGGICISDLNVLEIWFPFSLLKCVVRVLD